MFRKTDNKFFVENDKGCQRYTMNAIVVIGAPHSQRFRTRKQILPGAFIWSINNYGSSKQRKNDERQIIINTHETGALRRRRPRRLNAYSRWMFVEMFRVFMILLLTMGKIVFCVVAVVWYVYRAHRDKRNTRKETAHRNLV